jgi:HSP20 family protein
MDRLLDEFWSGGAFPGFGAAGTAGFAPDVDVEETAEAVRVKADLPGLSEKDFHVSVEGDLLTISGERRSEDTREEGGRKWTERTYGKFERTVRLPAEVEVDKANATFTNGVLAVTLPKNAKARTQSHKIDVKSS